MSAAPGVTGLCPLVQVHDMAASLEFYRDKVGFELVQHSAEIDAPEGRYFHWCLLKLGDAYLMLNTMYDAGERPSERDHARQSAHRDTALFFGCANADAVHAHLTAQGLDAPLPSMASYGLKGLSLRDPDGYEICFQESA